MNTEQMDIFTLKRWGALIDAVNTIYDVAEKNGMDLEEVTLKQNHLVRYVDESTEKVRIV